MKILVLRFSSIGDIVLTTPVLRVLKKQLPNIELHYATKSSFKEILIENPYIDRLHLLEDRMNKLIKSLKKEKFDLIIDLHQNLRTRLIKQSLMVKSVGYKKYNLEKWLFTNFKINLLPKTHLVDRYLESLKDLGVNSDDQGLDYFIPEKDEVEIDWLPRSFQQGYVAVVIGGKYSTKRLPESRLIELCDRINKPIVLIGGSEENRIGESIEAFFARNEGYDRFAKGLDELGKRAIVFNACGKFNLNQSASLVKQANWVFTHDTGLMHIAAAFKKEIFSIWGSTVPEFGMYPYRTKFTIFENKRLSCRPCSKLGHKKCPKGHFKCMKEVSFDFYLPD